jgi:AcrR family transcriptional regulator
MPGMPRRSAAAVAETRSKVTQAAVERASVEGLEGLTIGRLADEARMRKSSVFSLFGSKQELQLAALEGAVEQFTDEVWGPVAGERPGLPRLLALCDRWLAYHERGAMPGGCFLTTATVEYDARPGPLRDAVARTMQRWFGVLEREVATAIEAGDLPADTNERDVAFQLNALAAAASYGFQLSRDPEVFAVARRSMRTALAPG